MKFGQNLESRGRLVLSVHLFSISLLLSFAIFGTSVTHAKDVTAVLAGASMAANFFKKSPGDPPTAYLDANWALLKATQERIRNIEEGMLSLLNQVAQLDKVVLENSRAAMAENKAFGILSKASQYRSEIEKFRRSVYELSHKFSGNRLSYAIDKRTRQHWRRISDIRAHLSELRDDFFLREHALHAGAVTSALAARIELAIEVYELKNPENFDIAGYRVTAREISQHLKRILDPGVENSLENLISQQRTKLAKFFDSHGYMKLSDGRRYDGELGCLDSRIERDYLEFVKRNIHLQDPIEDYMILCPDLSRKIDGKPIITENMANILGDYSRVCGIRQHMKILDKGTMDRRNPNSLSVGPLYRTENTGRQRVIVTIRDVGIGSRYPDFEIEVGVDPVENGVIDLSCRPMLPNFHVDKNFTFQTNGLARIQGNYYTGVKGIDEVSYVVSRDRRNVSHLPAQLDLLSTLSAARDVVESTLELVRRIEKGEVQELSFDDVEITDFSVTSIQDTIFASEEAERLRELDFYEARISKSRAAVSALMADKDRRIREAFEVAASAQRTNRVIGYFQAAAQVYTKYQEYFQSDHDEEDLQSIVVDLRSRLNAVAGREPSSTMKIGMQYVANNLGNIFELLKMRGALSNMRSQFAAMEAERLKITHTILNPGEEKEYVLYTNGAKFICLCEKGVPQVLNQGHKSHGTVILRGVDPIFRGL